MILDIAHKYILILLISQGRSVPSISYSCCRSLAPLPRNLLSSTLRLSSTDLGFWDEASLSHDCGVKTLKHRKKNRDEQGVGVATGSLSPGSCCRRSAYFNRCQDTGEDTASENRRRQPVQAADLVTCRAILRVVPIVSLLSWQGLHRIYSVSIFGRGVTYNSFDGIPSWGNVRGEVHNVHPP